MSKTSKESLRAGVTKDYKELLRTDWGTAEDLRLLELRRVGKSWEYIEGKLDDKGKDVQSLKTRFKELTSMKDAVVMKRKKEKSNGGEQENSPGKKGVDKKGEEKVEESQAENDEASKKFDDGSKKANGILKTSPKGGKKVASGDKQAPKSENHAVTGQREGYIGKHGRGEVRFFNGIPVLYKHSGSNAEPLDALTVGFHPILVQSTI